MALLHDGSVRAGSKIGRLLLASAAIIALAACGTSGGGSPAEGASDPVAAAVGSVDLEPGQSSAQLAWAASEGAVDGYLVFESRNGEGFAYTEFVPTETTQIEGEPGDSVQVTVVAVAENGSLSESSPPSPTINFHPEEASAEAAVAVSATGGMATPTPTPSTGAETDSHTNTDTTPQESPADLASTEASDETRADAAEESDTRVQLAEALRSLLLRGDTRLPESGLSDEARRWLQDQVDQSIAAGVSLAGTGHRDDDAIREIIWQDSAGQLFVSDGRSMLTSEDLPSTFEESIRLHPTERFAALADFNGDQMGDWLIQDEATGEVWIIDGASELLIDAQRPQTGVASEEAAHSGEWQLAGQGDFDGDERAEILWINENRTLAFERPGGRAPALSTESGLPVGFVLDAIADLDGDGRDDLLGRGMDGEIQMGFSRGAEETGDSVYYLWQAGPAESVEGLDLVATLDLDEDGTAELVWLNAGELEVWSAQRGQQNVAGL